MLFYSLRSLAVFTEEDTGESLNSLTPTGSTEALYISENIPKSLEA